MPLASSRAIPGAPPITPGPEAGASDVEVVRLPIADARGGLVGYELVFAPGLDDAAPAAARTTAAMLDGAFADIGLDRLTGRHPAWVSVSPEFLVAVGAPPVRPDRAVLQIAAHDASEDLLELLRRLSAGGYTMALTGYDGTAGADALLEVCSVAKVPFDRLDPDGRATLVGKAMARGAQVVATGIDDEDLLSACHELRIPLVQGTVLARPRMVRGRNVATSSAASLRTLSQLSGGDLPFDEIERVVASDVALSLKLLRYVNSAFFSLPRTIGSVHEALALLGSRTVQRWAMVVVMADAPDAPDHLVALALQRGRMCEMLAAAIAPEEQATLFTIGLFSVADVLLGMPMEDVLDELPFSPEIQAALLRHEGPKGSLLSAVLAYERGEFPELPDIAAQGGSVAGAYRAAVEWADDATSAVCGQSVLA